MRPSIKETSVALSKGVLQVKNKADKALLTKQCYSSEKPVVKCLLKPVSQFFAVEFSQVGGIADRFD